MINILAQVSLNAKYKLGIYFHDIKKSVITDNDAINQLEKKNTLTITSKQQIISFHNYCFSIMLSTTSNSTSEKLNASL